MTTIQPITPAMIRTIHSQRASVRRAVLEQKAIQKALTREALLAQVDAAYLQQADILAQKVLDRLYVIIMNQTGKDYAFIEDKVTVELDEADFYQVVQPNDDHNYLRSRVEKDYGYSVSKYFSRGGNQTWVTYESDRQTPLYNIRKDVLLQKVKVCLERQGFATSVPSLFLPKNRRLNMAIYNTITVTIK